MDQTLLDVGLGILAAGGTLGALHWFKPSKSAVPPVKTDGIPLIEIDGKMVPHPTIVARRQKRQEQLNSGR